METRQETDTMDNLQEDRLHNPANDAVEPQEGQEKMQKLYRCDSRLTSLNHEGMVYKDVNVDWFVWDRQKPVVPYEEAIENYGKLDEDSRARAERFIDGLFTRHEAFLLAGYLMMNHDSWSNIREQTLPIESEHIEHLYLPLGDKEEMHSLFEEYAYDVPFKVVGLYDVPKALELGSIVIRKSMLDREHCRCPICDGWLTARKPYEAYPLNAWTAVCPECLKKNAPVLDKLLDYFYSSEELQREFFES